MKIGIIGTGNIARFLLESINGENKINDLMIVSILGRNKEVGTKLADMYNLDYFDEINEFLNSSVDIVVEAATIEVARKITTRTLQSNKNLVLSSVGSLSDLEFYQCVELTAKENGKKVYIPSGAIGGIDIIKSANSLGGLKAVSITTRKSPESLGITHELASETILFEGNAIEAIKRFPSNTNVSIILSLAGVGAEETKVTIIADPKVNKNSHTIDAIGEFGKFNLVIENEPMPNNPKTSYLATLSILSILKNMESSVIVGN